MQLWCNVLCSGTLQVKVLYTSSPGLIMLLLPWFNVLCTWTLLVKVLCASCLYSSNLMFCVYRDFTGKGIVYKLTWFEYVGTTLMNPALLPELQPSSQHLPHIISPPSDTYTAVRDTFLAASPTESDLDGVRDVLQQAWLRQQPGKAGTTRARLITVYIVHKPNYLIIKA